MLKKFLLLITIVAASNGLLFAQSSGTLKGKILDKDTKEPIPFANVILESGGRQIGGTTTDFDGSYVIKPIPPGRYDLKTTYVGYHPLQVNGIIISPDQITTQNLNLASSITNLEVVEVIDYKVPLIEKGKTTSGGTVTSEELKKMPGRSVEGVAISVGGVFSSDGEMGGIRGAREEGTITYIDGVRVRGSAKVNQAAIDQVSVYTGGLPASIGDATGGVVNITTKGPSREFSGGAEYLTSQYLDAYGYNLIGLNLQGPLLKSRKDSTQSIVGFFISSEFTAEKDGDPSNIGVTKLRDTYLDSLELNPLRPTGLGFGSYANAEFTTKDKFENIKAKQNARSQNISLSGKFDIKTSKNTNLTLGGNFDYNKYNAYIGSYSLFNAVNNPQVKDQTMRFFGRFTQKFPTATDSKALIRNVNYSIQADYSSYNYVIQNENYTDNLFKYGYIGKFKTDRIAAYEPSTLIWSNGDTLKDILVHTGFMDTLCTFTPSDANPELANYTSQYYTLYPFNSFYYPSLYMVQAGGGLVNGDSPESVYGLWSNTGTVYDSYNKLFNTQYSVNANGSADVGINQLQFGFSYEQRKDNQIGYSPAGLWGLMRGLVNRHISELDLDHPQIISLNGDSAIYYDFKFDTESAYKGFDYNLRQALGMPTNSNKISDWIDVDNVDPEILKIDMFTADELLNNGNSFVSYYGYDHTGKMLKNKPSFDDFFTAKDEKGNYTRLIGAYEPIYWAGYIQDKIDFNDDLLLNIGLRVDQFDANQKVLKDNYLMRDAKTVAEVSNLGSHPSNMGQDYVVYVNDLKEPSSIVGYRDGGVWYNAEGSEIKDPTVLETPNGIAPYLLDPNQLEITSSSFKDYEPQTIFMPRIAFSFPISDVANFFAHYDVLTVRPFTGIRLDPTDYFFIEQIGNATISNPSLKPEKTIDYELGFQQKLSNASALKFSAYYREMRDQVQVFRFTDAYPRSYISYNNIDFGTVKGFTLAYDLRRVKNVWVKASYTLQFADGTGSSATSALALVRSGQANLRNTTPLSIDRRHSFSTIVDFRFGEGAKEYNGPKKTKTNKATGESKTIEYLKNTGVNFTLNGGSGVPYTKYSKIMRLGQTNLIEGSINGSRMPWQFRVDARVDRDMEIKVGKGDNKRTIAYLNAYVQVLNVLNTVNIMNVYGATGNPDDDGYLNAAEWQKEINGQLSPQSYRDLYALLINDPDNYSLPRRIRLGIAISF